jgi:hypothetical protein
MRQYGHGVGSRSAGIGLLINHPANLALAVFSFSALPSVQSGETSNDLRPGENLPVQEFIARYNNTYFPLKDESDYLTRRNRKKVNRGRAVQWFERYAFKGVSGVHSGMKRGVLKACPSCAVGS